MKQTDTPHSSTATRSAGIQAVRMSSTLAEYAQYKTLNITQPSEYVVHVEMNRPEKRNALNMEMWK